jgi:hypothetical protein
VSGSGHDTGGRVAVLVTARDESARLGITLSAVRMAFPTARVVVADDGSRDATPEIAEAHGAELVRCPRRGKGQAATAAARTLAGTARPAVVVLCDGDLGDSASCLGELEAAVTDGRGDLAVAAFRRRVGGGFGIVLHFAAAAVERRGGVRPGAPLSGQRALTWEALQAVLPFAPGFGMETGMTIDALRAGFRLVEVELPLTHRATGRSPAGFLHRASQLRDVVRAGRARRPRRT